jgi:benzylsuccinate CoA-transferase BbsF subunit
VERDPQLAHRGHWVRLDHAEMGRTIYNTPPLRFSRTPAKLTRPAPLLGEHTDEVCRELLGLSEEETRKLREEGVLV